jgi:hypothetical protein
MSPAPKRPRTEIRLGARAHTTANQRWPYPHAPPKPNTSKLNNPDAAFDARSLDR